MKQCPACAASYPDTVRFCAADGSTLVPVTAATAPAQSGLSGTVVAAILGGLLVLVAGAFLFMRQQERIAEAEQAAEAARLEVAQAEAATARRQAADAEARAASAEAAARAVSGPPIVTASGYSRTARADSPNDGFLALRSQPSSRSGARLAQIPHDAVIHIGDCQPVSQVPGGRVGQWCRTEWAGMYGWAFTGFMRF